jgi:hypothetical protein
VLKIKKSDIAVCKANIPEMYWARYWALFSAGQVRLESKKCSNAFVEEHVSSLQSSAVDNLLQKKRGGVVVSGSSVLPSSTNPFSRNSGAASTCTTVSSFTEGRKHSPFAFSSQRSIESSMKMDIRQSNNATVEMAIADFFHCENIPDAVVESPRFVRLVRVCRLVGDDFVLPNQRRIGGDLLDINYTNVYQRNKEKLMKEAKVFGLAFMGDGALSIECLS